MTFEEVKPGECYVCTGKREPNFGKLEGVKCQICNDSKHIHPVTRTSIGRPVEWGPRGPCKHCPVDRFEGMEEELAKCGTPANKALVVVCHGIAYVVLYDLGTELEELLLANGGKTDGFTLSHANIDHAEMPPGVWTVSVRVIDDGPGDWPGSRESAIQFYDERLATKEEWEGFCEGALPW